MCENLPPSGTHPLHRLEEKDILPRAQGKQMPSKGNFISTRLDLKKLTSFIRGGFEGRPIITYRDWDAPNDDFQAAVRHFILPTIGFNLSLDCVDQGKSLYIATMQIIYFTTKQLSLTALIYAQTCYQHKHSLLSAIITTWLGGSFRVPGRNF